MTAKNLAAHMATVLFDASITSLMENLKVIVKDTIPSATFTVSGGDTGIVTFGGASFAIMYIAAPYPPADFDRLLLNNYVLKNSQTIKEQQKSHIIISSLSTANNLSESIQQACALTHLTAVVAQLQDILAVLWNTSGVIQSPDEFNQSLSSMGKAMAAQQAGQVGGHLLPITLWVGLRFYSPTQNENAMGVVSKGMNAFTGTELNLLPADRKNMVAAQELYALISYTFYSGLALRNGDSLELGEYNYSVVLKDDTALVSRVQGKGGVR